MKVTFLSHLTEFEHKSLPIREQGCISAQIQADAVGSVSFSQRPTDTMLPSSLTCAKMQSALRCTVSKTMMPHPANDVSPL